MARPYMNPYLDDDEEEARRDRFGTLVDVANGYTEEPSEIEPAWAALQQEYPEGDPNEGAGPAATPEQYAAAQREYERDFPSETARLRQTQPGLFATPAVAQASGPRLPAAAADPSPQAAPQQQPVQQDSPWNALANYRQWRARGAASMEPPAVPKQDKTWLGIGAAADVLFNRGRGLGQLAGLAAQPDRSAMQAYQLQQQSEAHDADMMRALAQAQGREGDPAAQLYREQMLELAKNRDARATERAQAESDARARDARMRDPNSEETAAAREVALAAGANPEAVAKMTGYDITAWRPQLGQEIDRLQGNEEWRNRRQMTNADQLAKEGREETRELGKEGRGEERETGKRSEDFATSYATKYDKDLAIAGLIQEINAAGGAAPQSFSERFEGTLAARGIDPSRLEAWRAKQMVVEEWGRKQSQGAIGMEEGDRLKIQTALQPTATEADVNAAYAVMERHVKRYIRMGAVGNPTAARTVTQAAGLNDSWLAGIGDVNPQRGKHTPKPSGGAPANDGEPKAKKRRSNMGGGGAGPSASVGGVNPSGSW